jgi:anti-sigma factor ChrR (cupin superfamily)
MQTLILRLAPGAKYPSHRHKRAEQCLVLSGQVSIGPGINIGPGDFEWAEASTDHDAVYSEHGCDLLIIASRHDEVLASPNLRGGE